MFQTIGQVKQFEVLTELPEMKKSVKSLLTVEREPIELFYKYSTLEKLKRVTGWIIRFVRNCKNQGERVTENTLSVNEINEAFIVLIKMSQGESFSEEITCLRREKPITKGRLCNLNPFLDDAGLLRVGGRLQLSQLEYDKRHPMIIGSKHSLTELIFISEHNRLLHAGPQMLLSSIRDRFWPIQGRNVARRVVHRCVTCFKRKPTTKNPIMGYLPRNRVEPRPAFFTTGCDYTGPFLLKNRLGRGNTIYKCYVCVLLVKQYI